MQLFENEHINVTKIYTVNMYKAESPFGQKRTNHYSAKLFSNELIFFISGESTTHFKGLVIHDAPNSLRFMPKGDEEGEYFVEINESTVCFDIYFDAEVPMSEPAFALKNMNELKSLFEKIYNVWQSKKTGYYSKALSLLYEIIYRIKIHNQKYYTHSQQKKLLPSYEYMMAHFAKNDFDYKEMCSKSGLSYGYFKEQFIKQYGVSPVKYVTMLKIEKAKELIVTGRFSVSEIAEMCGFENIYYFSNVFKKLTGVSPKNYTI